jgi:hypothetical protein
MLLFEHPTDVSLRPFIRTLRPRIGPDGLPGMDLIII